MVQPKLLFVLIFGLFGPQKGNILIWPKKIWLSLKACFSCLFSVFSNNCTVCFWTFIASLKQQIWKYFHLPNSQSLVSSYNNLTRTPAKYHHNIRSCQIGMVKLFYTILPIFDTWKKSRFPKVVNMENSLFYCPDLHKKAKKCFFQQ